VNVSLLKGIAKYGIGLGLLAYVVAKNWDPTPGPGLADALRRPVQALPLVLTVVITAAAVLLTFVRWHVLVRAQHLPLTLPAALRLGLVGYFYNTFLPGAVGGDAVKAYCLARAQERRTVAVATVLCDRIIGLWSLVVLVALVGGLFWLQGNPVLFANDNLLAILRTSWVIVLVSLAAVLPLGLLSDDRAERLAGRLGRVPKLGHFLAESWRAAWMYHRQRTAVALAVLLSLIGHVGFVLGFHFAAQIFHDPSDPAGLPTLTEHFLIVPVGMVVKAFFPTPGGVGAGEYSYGKLYALVRRPEATGVLGSLALLVVTWGLGLVGYLVHVLSVERQPEEELVSTAADGL
jgi:uncharacterized protein (TIRG00374 family)